MKTLTPKLSRIVIVLLSFSLACNPSPTQMPTPTNEIRPSATIEPIPTSAITSTASPNVIDLASASKLPLPTYKQECANILQPNPIEFEKTLQDFSATGTAVFRDINDGYVIVLYNLESRAKHVFPAQPGPQEWVDEPAVSPNRKWLFYWRSDGPPSGNANFLLSNSTGESLKTFPASFTPQYLHVHEWLNDNSVRLLGMLTSDQLAVVLLDPFTEKVTPLENKFDGLQPPRIKFNGWNENGSPNQEYLDWGVDPFFDVIIRLLNGANVAYSPDTTLAFYPHKDGSAVLYDVSNKKELAHVVLPNWGELPKWSPDGKYISVIATPPNTSQDAAKKDFYLISRDGKQIQRLTYLAEQLDRVSIKEYTWSPDSTRIAFWLNTNFPLAKDEIVPYELAIVDVKSGAVTNYCMSYQNHNATPEELASRAGVFIEPIWSPDGRQLLVPNSAPAKMPSSSHSQDVKLICLIPTNRLP